MYLSDYVRLITLALYCLVRTNHQSCLGSSVGIASASEQLYKKGVQCHCLWTGRSGYKVPGSIPLVGFFSMGFFLWPDLHPERERESS